MKIRYSYALLKYVHDAVTGEFANVGVILFAPEASHIAFKGSPTYGRLSQFFPGMDGDHFRRMIRSIELRAQESSRDVSGLFKADVQERAAFELGNRILPLDDSSLRFAEGGSGVSNDLAATLDRIYERYVERYSRKEQSQRRSDGVVLYTFKRLLVQRKLFANVPPKVIEAKDYQHEFPIAWKNGSWNVCEPVSFDYSDGSHLIERANTWLGRGVSLNDSREKFKLHLLVGKPRDAKLKNVYQKALNILRKMPLKPELVEEDEAKQFVDPIERDVAHQSC